MKKLFARVQDFFRSNARRSHDFRPLSDKELQREAEKFAEKYGDVLKKLAQE